VGRDSGHGRVARGVAGGVAGITARRGAARVRHKQDDGEGKGRARARARGRAREGRGEG